MKKMKSAILLLTLSAIAMAAPPASFYKTSDGWSRVTSRALVQRMVETAEENYDLADSWEDSAISAVETDDEDEVGEWIRGPGDDDDDKDDDGKDDGSGNDKRERDMAGVCIHRGTQHTIERGSVEFHQNLCLLCACQQSGSLHCLKTC